MQEARHQIDQPADNVEPVPGGSAGDRLERLIKRYGRGPRLMKPGPKKLRDRSKYDGKGNVKRELYGEGRR